MRINKILVILFLFLLFLVLGAFYFSYNLDILYFFKSERDFGRLVEDIDNYFFKDNLDKIQSAIRFSASYADTEFKWLALIKRAKMLSVRTNDYSLMKEISEFSVKFLPGNLKLRALEVYSKLKNGAFKDAYIIAKQYLLSHEEYRDLYKEAFIKNLILENNFLDINELLTKIDEEKNAHIFEEIGLGLKNNAFLVNAMLLYIKENNFNAAKRVLIKIKEDRDFAKELAYISYSLNNLDFIISNLKLIDIESEPSLIFLLADAYFRKGDIFSAKNEYFKLYTRFPNYNIVVYLNLALIASNENDFKKAISYLKKADEIFTGNRVINYYLANIYFRIKDFVKANEIASNYKDDHLFYKINFLLNYSHLEYEAKKSFLWCLFYKTEYDSNISQFLSWNLLLYSDLRDLDLFFKIYDISLSKPYWYDFYRFYYYFLKKDFSTSKKVILESKSDKYRFGIYYNLGVLSFLKRNYKEAEEYFNKAMSFLPNSFYDKDNITQYERKVMAKIYLKQGVNYLRLGNIEKGGKFILTSISFYETDEGKLYKNMINTLKEKKFKFE